MVSEQFRVMVLGLLGRAEKSTAQTVAHAIGANGMAYGGLVDPKSLATINTGIVRTDAVIFIVDLLEVKFYAGRPTSQSDHELWQIAQNIGTAKKRDLPTLVFILGENREARLMIRNQILRGLEGRWIGGKIEQPSVRIDSVPNTQFALSINKRMADLRKELDGVRLRRPIVGASRALSEEETEQTLSSGIQQRPATYRFGLQNGKITALPDPVETSDDAAAQDIYEELTAKVRMLADRMRTSDSHRSASQAIARLLDSLGSSIADVRPGRLLSSSRTISSFRDAFNSEEGRQELFPDAIAMMGDVSDSLQDLLALFPTVREIEVERIALDLQRDPNQLATIERETLAIKAAAAESGDATDEALKALSANDADIESTTDIILETELRADNLLVVRNFAGAAARGAAQLGGEVWQAVLTNLPQGVGDAARVAPILGLAGLVAFLAGPIGGIAAIVAGFGPIVRALHQLRRSDQRTAGAPPRSAPAKTPSGNGYYRNFDDHLVKSGLTVPTVAEQAGLSRNTVLRTKGCRSPVAAITVRKVIEALNKLHYDAHPPRIEFEYEFEAATAGC